MASGHTGGQKGGGAALRPVISFALHWLVSVAAIGLSVSLQPPMLGMTLFLLIMVVATLAINRWGELHLNRPALSGLMVSFLLPWLVVVFQWAFKP